MTRAFKRDNKGRFASAGSSSKAASKSKKSSTTKTPRSQQPSKLGERIANMLVSPERKEYRRKKTLANQQYERDLNSPKSNYANGDRDVMNRYLDRKAKAKAEFKAAKAKRKNAKS